MNFYKHHLGDYDGHTAHLSWDEDMAYTRLLRAYYRREAPIPTEEAYRLARASSKGQRAAVDSVLHEFFSQGEGGWHNKRADQEISSYRAQAETNRRIARERTVRRTVDDSLTKGIPSHKPDTRSQIPEKEKSRARAKGNGRAARETPLPVDFKISERVKTWASQKGFSNLDAYLESFVSKAKAKGYTYVDWDEAFMCCIRDDWPELRKGATPTYDLSRFPDAKV